VAAQRVVPAATDADRASHRRQDDRPPSAGASQRGAAAASPDAADTARDAAADRAVTGE